MKPIPNPWVLCHRYPMNGILMLLFTFFESFALGCVCAIYQASDLGGVPRDVGALGCEGPSAAAAACLALPDF